MTSLDRTGIPIYFSFRPSSRSQLIQSGKGFRAIDAKVGAYMEAIELALAEYGRSPLEIISATARQLLDGERRKDAILDFCPAFDASIRLSDRLPCVIAMDLFSGRPMLAPAELVFVPLLRVGTGSLFGSFGNGLSSGNSLEEASLHGLLEIIERDTLSFHYLKNQTRGVCLSGLPDVFGPVLERLKAADIDLSVRFAPNEWGIPVFAARMADRSQMELGFSGSGCHLDPSIALIRAVSEAAQARICYLHGTRLDMERLYGAPNVAAASDPWFRPEEARAAESDESGSLEFREIAACADAPSSVVAAWTLLTTRLFESGFKTILRVAYTDERSALQVIRLIVPRMEFYNRNSRRVGPRLKKLLQSL